MQTKDIKIGEEYAVVADHTVRRDGDQYKKRARIVKVGLSREEIADNLKAQGRNYDFMALRHYRGHTVLVELLEAREGVLGLLRGEVGDQRIVTPRHVVETWEEHVEGARLAKLASERQAREKADLNDKLAADKERIDGLLVKLGLGEVVYLHHNDHQATLTARLQEGYQAQKLEEALVALEKRVVA